MAKSSNFGLTAENLGWSPFSSAGTKSTKTSKDTSVSGSPFGFGSDSMGYGQIAGVVAGALSNAFDEYSRASQTQDYYRGLQSNYENEAALAGINADMYKNQLYAVGEQYEMQALQEGLRNAQAIAGKRAQVAGSGVRLNVGSAAEAEASQRIAAAMDNRNINYNRTVAQNQVRTQVAQWQMEQRMAEAQAKAAKAMRKSVNPVLNLIGAAAGGGMSIDSDWQGGGYDSIFAGISNLFS